MSQELADAVVNLLDALENACHIERCTHRNCGALSSGLPDFGPHVGDSVCEEHLPQYAHLIPSHEDMTNALREVYVVLEKYDYHYDPKTGRAIGGDDETDPVDIGEGI